MFQSKQTIQLGSCQHQGAAWHEQAEHEPQHEPAQVAPRTGLEAARTAQRSGVLRHRQHHQRCRLSAGAQPISERKHQTRRYNKNVGSR